MRSILSYLLALIMLSVNMVSLAENVDNSHIIREIQNDEYITLTDAISIVEASGISDWESNEFLSMLNNLRACSGVFVQLPEDLDDGNIYTANVSFFFNMGMPYCNVEYTNYAGTISDGLVEPLVDSPYLFSSQAEGEFLTNDTLFSFEFAPDLLHIQWADGVCEYWLERGTDEQIAMANAEPPFIETETYAQIVQTIDEAFDELEHSFNYDEENKTLTVYVACGEGYKDTLLNYALELEDQWNNVLDGLMTITEKMDDVLTLTTRSSIMDISQAQFSIILVDKLISNNEYSDYDYIGIVTDGSIIYSAIDEVIDGKVSNGYIATPSTMGESNALKQAKAYLDVMPFSYEGLIEQLEYEGYTHSEAVYGADYCGADWYEQAVKSARKYLNIMSFSRSGLIDQLVYEGYTYDQAVYGVEQNGY